MILHKPFIITSRLLVGLKIGSAIVSLGEITDSNNGRIRYHFIFDISGEETFRDNSIQSGCFGGRPVEGFIALLSSLSAAVESYNYSGMDGENSDLFPERILIWADQNDSEIQLLQCEFEESEIELIEE